MIKFKHLLLPDDFYKHPDYIKMISGNTEGCTYNTISSCKKWVCDNCWFSYYRRSELRENQISLLDFAAAEKQKHRKRYTCSVCEDHSCSATGKKPTECLHRVRKPDWHRVDSDKGKEKLTPEIFCRPDCPDWAVSAAVDGDGKAHWYSDIPDVYYEHGIWAHPTGSKGCHLRVNGEFSAKNWANSLIKRPADARPAVGAPKLTQAVFSLPDCPAAAKFAAVDEDGKAFWYDQRPTLRRASWLPGHPHYRIPGKFSAEDWKNSLIERVCPACGK